MKDGLHLYRPTKCCKELQVERAQISSVGICNNGLSGTLSSTNIERKQRIMGPRWQSVKGSQFCSKSRLGIVEGNQSWHWRVNCMAPQGWQ